MTHSHHDSHGHHDGHHGAHGHHAAGHDHGDAGSPAAGDDLLDLDGEVLAASWDAALDRVVAAWRSEGASGGRTPVRVVDLGAGTGTGAVGLARRLPDAEVVAVDLSEESLARVAAKAVAAGVGERVRTLVADLDQGWPDLAPIDLTLASMSLHHLADPVRALTQLRRITAPGGLLAVSEFDEPLRFLPDDLGVGRPGLESRAVEALSAVHEEAALHIGASWPDLLGEAGWTVLGQHDVVVDERSPRHPLAGTYARGWFERLAGGVSGRLDADDERTLAVLLDDDSPQSLMRRTDLHLHGTRTLTLAQA